MAVFVTDKVLVKAAWTEFGNLDILRNNDWYGEQVMQWPGFISNIFICTNMDELNQFFIFKREAKNPKNIEKGKRNRNK